MPHVVIGADASGPLRIHPAERNAFSHLVTQDHARVLIQLQWVWESLVGGSVPGAALQPRGAKTGSSRDQTNAFWSS